MQLPNNELNELRVVFTKKMLPATEFQVNNESVQIGCFLRRQDENNSDESVYYLRKSHIISPKDEFIDLKTEQHKEQCS